MNINKKYIQVDSGNQPGITQNREIRVHFTSCCNTDILFSIRKIYLLFSQRLDLLFAVSENVLAISTERRFSMLTFQYLLRQKLETLILEFPLWYFLVDNFSEHC